MVGESPVAKTFSWIFDIFSEEKRLEARKKRLEKNLRVAELRIDVKALEELSMEKSGANFDAQVAKRKKEIEEKRAEKQ